MAARIHAGRVRRDAANAGLSIVQCVPYKHQKLWLARSLLVTADGAKARRGAQANCPVG
jgi:hypothetical protein